MLFYYVFKDGQMQGRFTTKEEALYSIRFMQKMETHPILRANFTIIQGFAEESIGYEKK